MELLLVIFILIQIVFYFKLNKLIKMAESAEQTADQILGQLGIALDFIEGILSDGSDLTAQELRDKWAPYKARLDAIAPPQDQ